MPIADTDRSAASASSSEIYLRVQSRRAGLIKGEASTPDHENDIEAVSWGWSLSARSATGTPQSGARRSYSSLQVVKRIDSATTALMNALAANDEIREAKLMLRKSGGEPLDYLTITLGGARVEEIEHAVDGSGETFERVNLVFTRVDVEYRSQDAAGGPGATTAFADEILPP